MPDDTSPAPAPAVPPFRDSLLAPFIYFDVAASHGVLNGTIQVEIAARTLSPTPDGNLRIEIIPTARLRCSPAAAKNLRDSLDAALKMLEGPQGNTSVAANKLN